MSGTVNISGLSETIQSDHARIHQGQVYSVDHIFTGVADTTSVDVLMITGDSEAHAVIRVKAEDQTEIDFYEQTTVTDNGTELTSFNRNEQSDKTANTTCYYSPTIDSIGTEKPGGFIPSGNPGEATVSGEAGGRNEYIIAPNSQHLIRAINQSGQDEIIYFKVIWYEPGH